MYPDQSLYPANSGPDLVRRINNTLTRADQIEHMEGKRTVEDWFAPIVADCEAGFGGVLNAFELTKAFIEAGAAGVHFEDQLASEKKCGHMGGKVLVPMQQHIANLNAARMAADVMGTSTLVVCRTDAESARLITSDVDPRDHPFLMEERTAEGFHRLKDGTEFERCVARGLALVHLSRCGKTGLGGSRHRDALDLQCQVHHRSGRRAGLISASGIAIFSIAGTCRPTATHPHFVCRRQQPKGGDPVSFDLEMRFVKTVRIMTASEQPLVAA